MNIQPRIAANKRNTIFIMAIFIGIVGAIGWVISYMLGGVSVLYGVIGVSLLYVLFQYFMADKLALMSTGARQIEEKDNPRLWGVVAKLAQQANLPMPRVYIVDDDAPNAFATGRDPRHAAVAATTGILDVMDDRELTAVFAHEVSHVKNYDIRVSMIAFGLVSVVSVLTNMLSWMFMFGGNRDNNNSNPVDAFAGIILIILAPLAAMMVQMAISRQREYLADVSGADTTRDPEGLARALEKLLQYGQPLQRQDTTTAHLFISNPLQSGTLLQLFSTHPPLEKRIARLRGEIA